MCQYPRLRELSKPFEDIAESYFYRFWPDFHKLPVRVQAFDRLEAELKVLDQHAWKFLQNEASHLVRHKHPKRGWTQLFDKLNEAKGYSYLIDQGCTDPAFIPRSTRERVETPDLRATLDNVPILCEVKTINVSDYLIKAWHNRDVREVQNHVTPELTAKLESTLAKAKSQLTSFESALNAKRIAYFVINFDDGAYYRNELISDARKLFDRLDCEGVDVVIHNECAET